MLLKITHTTDLSYSEPISESVMELRMVPRQENDQRRLSFNLAIGPATTTLSYFDWLGNTVHAYTINAFHNQIQTSSLFSVVETGTRQAFSDGDAWPEQLWMARCDLCRCTTSSSSAGRLSIRPTFSKSFSNSRRSRMSRSSAWRIGWST